MATPPSLELRSHQCPGNASKQHKTRDSILQLAPLNSTSPPVWTSLSTTAAAILSSPNTVTHLLNSMLAVAGGLIAAGIVLAGIGFIASGRDRAVFTTQIDMRDNAIVLGGVEVNEPEGIPFISRLAILGEIDTSDVADPAAPQAQRARALRPLI